MKQIFIVEIERPEGDPLDTRWLLTGIQQWGSHMLKPEDVAVIKIITPEERYEGLKRAVKETMSELGLEWVDKL